MIDPSRVVVFRKWEHDKRIVALFPGQAVNEALYGSYIHDGGHGSANFDYVVNNTIAPCPEEYAKLQKELERIDYKLRIVNADEITDYTRKP